jgi:hypothetical protein
MRTRGVLVAVVALASACKLRNTAGQADATQDASALDAVSPDARAPDASAPDATPVDAAPFTCGDDASLEPNDDFAHALVTPVRAAQSDYALDKLVICPTTDVDMYRITTTAAGQSVRITLTYDPSPGQLRTTLLDPEGKPVGFGQANGDTIVLVENGLPAGPWYVEVAAAAYGVENGYALAFHVTP